MSEENVEVVQLAPDAFDRGGSGFGPSGTTFETGVRSGNGLVTVTYTEVRLPT